MFDWRIVEHLNQVLLPDDGDIDAATHIEVLVIDNAVSEPKAQPFFTLFLKGLRYTRGAFSPIEGTSLCTLLHLIQVYSVMMRGFYRVGEVEAVSGRVNIDCRRFSCSKCNLFLLLFL